MYEVKLKRVVIKVKEQGSVYNEKIDCAEKAFMLFKAIWEKELSEDQESFVVLFLNFQLKVLGYRIISVGSLTQAQVDIKTIIRSAILLGSSRIIIAHNHPSGDLIISEPDRLITSLLAHTLALVDLSLEDHIILSKDKFKSLREEEENLFKVEANKIVQYLLQERS